MSDVIGWNLMYKITERDLKKKEDLLTLLIHFVLIKAGYKCMGLGEEQILTGNESASETLPSQWNASNNLSLRYVNNDVLYILRGVPVDGNIVYNFLRVDTLAVTNVAFNVDHTVEATKGDSIETLFKSRSSEVIDKIRVQLLNIGRTKEVSTQTSVSLASYSNVEHKKIGTNNSPLNPPPISMPGPDAQPEPFLTDPHLDLFRRSGSTIFNPFRPPGSNSSVPGFGITGGLPRAAIPPGARFDPFGSPGAPQPRPRQPPPDADEFMP